MLIIAGYCAAFIMGIVLGLMGGGGSILTIPVLVYLLGLPAEQAPVHSLFIVGTAAIVGAIKYLRLKKVSISTGLIFGIPSMIGVHISQFFIFPAIPSLLLVSDKFILTKGMGIMLTFSILLLLASWSMIRRKNRQSPDSNSKEIKLIPLILQGLIVGIFTGLVGAGGGFLIVPALLLLAKLPAKEAAGTSLLIIAANSLTGFGSALFAGSAVKWEMLLPFTAIAVGGIFAGVTLNKFIPAQKLKIIFGWFTLSMGILIVLKTISEGI